MASNDKTATIKEQSSEGEGQENDNSGENPDGKNGDQAPPNLGAQLSAADAATGGNIDKIREIIFGNQMRDYEKRFSRQEERLLKDSADLRDDIKRRFEQLENFVRTEIDALSDQLRNEQKDRSEADSDISRELRELTKSYERKVGQLDEQFVKGQRDLRQQLSDQARNLSDEIRHKVDELAATLDREANELRSDKTDRAALAALFSEMSLRLNDEFSLPSAE